MSKLLFDKDELLVVNPRLAVLIGLNEAIVLQQIHYWLDNKYCAGVRHGGRKWIYNTVSQWREQFPFMSPSTIKRTMLSLREKNVISVEKLSPDGRDHTNYYTVNYQELDEIRSKCKQPDKVQNEMLDGVKVSHLGGSEWDEPNNTENTTDISSSRSSKTTCPHQTLIDLFAEKVPDLPKPRIWTGKREKDMLARWKWVMANKVKDKDNAQADAIEFFAKFFDYVNDSDFLTGRSGAWDKCDLPWLMKEENFAKVIEGNYENKGN